MEVLVRGARPADIPQMCVLLSDLFGIETDFSPDRGKQGRGLELLLGEASGPAIVLVAEKAGEIIGMCSVQTVISTAEGGPAGLLEDLVVKKDHRGKGIGTRLLSEVHKWCVIKNISRIQLLRDADNLAARKFYSSNGWRETNLICMRKLP